MGNIGSGSGSSYPGALDTQSAVEVDSPSAGKTLARAAVPNDLASAVIAIETTLGANPLSWTTPAFDAGNFTASGSMTWDVGSSDVATFEYVILGKFMVFNFFLQTTTVGGTPDFNLQITIPAGKTSAKTHIVPVYVIDSGTSSVGTASVSAAGTIVVIHKDVVGNQWSAATNATFVTGGITFEIQ